tara:strand:- start:820 stop:1857 length:1038 start_codon:yes stop_codon:yes gene_type:complete
MTTCRNNTKKTFTTSGLSVHRQELNTTLENRISANRTVNFIPDNSGLLNTQVPQKNIRHLRAANEKVIENGNANSFIIMGGDRPAGLGSGYGGRGASPDSQGTNRIELTVGRMARANRGTGAADGTIADPSPFGDAAKIYVSDMTDADTNFGFCNAQLGNQTAQSAIVNFADQLRYFGVGGVQISTGQPQGARGFSRTGISTSRGGKVERAPPIVLAAGNVDSRIPIRGLPGISADQHVETLQGVAKGDNTVACIRELSDILDRVIGSLIRIGIFQGVFASILGVTVPPGIQPHHAAAAPLMVQETYESFIGTLVQLRTSKVFWELMYCNDSSPRLITSRNVFSS